MKRIPSKAVTSNINMNQLLRATSNSAVPAQDARQVPAHVQRPAHTVFHTAAQLSPKAVFT
jgi:hypothetical protein